eukprot:TRINITY_DN9902_c0_g1_i2.p1 TRINITY_DN9902_c0_g1~~TRINITY_DN9902_c0_g1_i2.p1  ORF type:complete len:186 (+),score=48.35 TRINITY_DN9902_c0_g1_i2:100-657(+)
MPAVVFLVLVLAAFSAGKVVWQHNEPVAIYESVAVSAASQSVVSGAGYNWDPQATLSVWDFFGNGTARWEYTAPDESVAAARNRGVVAGISNEATTHVSTVSAWNVAIESPLWTFQVPGVTQPAETNPVQISKDGSRVVFAVDVQSAGKYFTRIYWASNANTSKPVFDHYDCFVGETARNLYIST